MYYLMQGIYLFLVLALFVDAIVQARRSHEYELKSYNRWYFYVPILILLFGVMQLLLGY